MHNRKELQIDGRQVIVFECAEAEWALIQPVDQHDMDGLETEMGYLASHSKTPFTLVAFRVNDWNEELSPWMAPSVFRNKPFGAGAGETLRFVKEELLPLSSASKCCLGGYSLAGLFALWSGYQTDAFQGIVGASPSVWFSEWTEFAISHDMKAGRVYLSLGKKEPQAKNPVLARVGECIQKQYEALQCDKTMIWNEGNHFQDAAVRTAMGFTWMMEEK